MSALSSSFPGHRLEGVTAAWYEHDGRRWPHPLVWLHLDGVGSVKVACAGDGSLSLSLSNPEDSYEMPELQARIVVEPISSDFALAPFIGHVVAGARELFFAPIEFPVGFLLIFESGTVGLANVADEVVVCRWPSPEWTGFVAAEPPS